MTPTRNPSFNLDESAAQQSSATTSRPARRPRTGFFVPLDPITGEVDMSRANPDQIAKLNAVLKSKEEIKEMPKPRPEINPSVIVGFYSLLEIGIQKIGTMTLKWPPQLASEMYFSPDKKVALIEPTKTLVEKFAPLWLTDNQDFIAFGAALSAAVNDMVTKATERYMVKVLRGEAPPPPGFKFSGPPPAAAKPSSMRPVASVNVEPTEPPKAQPPTNGEDKSRSTVSVAGVVGFVPSVPSGVGVH